MILMIVILVVIASVVSTMSTDMLMGTLLLSVIDIDMSSSQVILCKKIIIMHIPYSYTDDICIYWYIYICIYIYMYYEDSNY